MLHFDTGVVVSDFQKVVGVEKAVLTPVGAEKAGNVVLTGYDPNTAYAVSVAALNENGRLGLFTRETIVGPQPETQDLSLNDVGVEASG